MSSPSHSASHHPVQLGVVMDPIDAISYKKDTTLALLWAASERGWQLWFLPPEGLAIINGVPRASANALQVFRDPNGWFHLETPAQDLELARLDIILMRKDPPFDMNYIYATYVLEAAQQLGTLVINNPESLRDCNEKIFATRFPQCCPPTLVTADEGRIRRFAEGQGDIVLKPLDGMGGEGVFRVLKGDTNLSTIIEMLSQHGRRPIMAQKYLPEISQGDKRILMVNGGPIPWCLARIPREGEARGNLAAGGRGEVRPLTERDRWIAAEVGPELRRRGLWFVGLDVIGDYLTEINVTSPTCLREIEAAQPCGIADQLMDAVEQALATR